MQQFVNDFLNYNDPINQVVIDCTKNVNSLTVVSFGTIVIWENRLFVQQVNQNLVLIFGNEGETLNQIFSFQPWQPCRFCIIRKTFI